MQKIIDTFLSFLPKKAPAPVERTSAQLHAEDLFLIAQEAERHAREARAGLHRLKGRGDDPGAREEALLLKSEIEAWKLVAGWVDAKPSPSLDKLAGLVSGEIQRRRKIELDGSAASDLDHAAAIQALRTADSLISWRRMEREDDF